MQDMSCEKKGKDGGLHASPQRVPGKSQRVGGRGMRNSGKRVLEKLKVGSRRRAFWGYQTNKWKDRNRNRSNRCIRTI